MNKAELVEALTGRLGDRKTALAALDAVLEEIQRAVSKGDKVSVAGFGVFEKRARAARMARNPRTGEAVKVKKTSVPAFRPGQGFKDLVSGKAKPAPAAKSGKKATAKKTTGTAAKKASTPAKSTAKKTAAKKTAAKKSTAKKTTAKKTTAPATKASTRKTAKRASKSTGAAKKSVKAATKSASKKAATTKSVAAKKTAKKAAKKK